MGNEAKKTFVQLLKYGVIGVSNTLITLVVFYVINTLMGLDYAVANTLGYILGLINSFVWNRTWVFRRGGTVRSRIYHLLCSADGREPMVVVHIVA